MKLNVAGWLPASPARFAPLRRPPKATHCRPRLCRGLGEEDEECSSSDEEVTEEGMVGQRINKKAQRKRVGGWCRGRGGAGPPPFLAALQSLGWGIDRGAGTSSSTEAPTPHPDSSVLMAWAWAQEYEEWKGKVMAEQPKAKKQKPLSEKSLRQATLSFGAPAAAAAQQQQQQQQQAQQQAQQQKQQQGSAAPGSKEGGAAPAGGTKKAAALREKNK